MKTGYIPNSKSDKRFRNTIWQHNREIAERDPIRKQERKLLDMKKGNGGEPCV
jgi:hypothetical protein